VCPIVPDLGTGTMRRLGSELGSNATEIKIARGGKIKKRVKRYRDARK